jgi:hypothetical protein
LVGSFQAGTSAVANKKSKTSARRPKARSVSREASKAPESAVEHSPAPDKAEPRAIGPMSDVEIGHVAGDVWGALSRNGELTLAALKKEVHAPADLVAAAIGWLAREHKLEFSTAGRSVKFSLRS